MEYLPTSTYIYQNFQQHLAKYSIHETYGNDMSHPFVVLTFQSFVEFWRPWWQL